MTEGNALGDPLSALFASERAALVGLSNQEVHHWAMTKGEEVEGYLRSLRALQNSSAPVNQLPNELLIKIFHLMDPRPGYSPGEAKYMRWIKLMKVCRYFHDIAVASPGLWNKIDVANGLQFLRLCLERSRDRPIYLLASKSSVDYTAVIQEVVPYGDRIRELRFANLENSGVLPVLDFPMPNLEVLMLHSLRSTPSLDSQTFIPTDTHFPHLFAVILVGIYIPWNCGIYRGLKRLDVSDISSDQRPTMDGFLDVLRACPSLEELSLRNSAPTPPNASAPYPIVGPSVSLPQLQNLHIVDFEINVAFLLAHLTCPTSLFLDIVSNFSHPPPDPLLSNSLSALPRDLTPFSIFSTAQTIVIDVAEDIEIEVSQCDYDMGHFPSMSLKINANAPQLNYSYCLPVPMLNELAIAFSAAPIKALQINADPEMLVSDNWLPAFQRWSDLRELHVEYSVQVVSAFLLLGQHDPSAPDRLLCPQLRTLFVTGSFNEEDGPEFAQALSAMLAFRSSKECPLDLLRFEVSRETLTEAFLEAFKPFVGTVEPEIKFLSATAPPSGAVPV